MSMNPVRDQLRHLAPTPAIALRFATTARAHSTTLSDRVILSGLHRSALRRPGAEMSTAPIAFDDHPFDKRFSDRIETVTIDSVFAWLDGSGLGGQPEVIR